MIQTCCKEPFSSALVQLWKATHNRVRSEKGEEVQKGVCYRGTELRSTHKHTLLAGKGVFNSCGLCSSLMQCSDRPKMGMARNLKCSSKNLCFS